MSPKKKKSCEESIPVSSIMVVFNAAILHLVASIVVYEKVLYHWDVFPIVLPPSLTVVTAENDGNKKSKALIVKDLYVASTFEELNIVSLDAKGNPQSLTEKQLKSIRKTGEFEVESINFPGQVHKWSQPVASKRN